METNQSQYEKMCKVYERYVRGELVPIKKAFWEEWICSKEDGVRDQLVFCSCCGHKAAKVLAEKAYKYCPECGADMQLDIETTPYSESVDEKIFV